LEHDGARGFYVKDLVVDGIKSASRFESRVAAAQQEISARFLVEMKRLQAEDLDAFEYTSRDPGPQTSVAFVRMENGVPFFAIRGFEYHDGPSPTVEISRFDCPGKDCSEGLRIEYIGKQNAIKAYFPNHVGETIDPVVLARKLVELEIEDEPSSVGPPIAILRLDPSGVTWISNGCGCPIETP
jgi:hypothetical protein